MFMLQNTKLAEQWKIKTHFHLSRFETPMAPDMQIFQMTAVEAFPIAIVGFAVAFAVAKVYSVKHDYVIDGNQVSPD